jgi:O-antigen/teichoic acid export membrane protein
LGTFAAIMAAALSIVNLRYETAVPLPAREEDAYSLARAAIRIGLGCSLILTALFIFVAPHVFDAAMQQKLMPYIWWLPIALALASATQALTSFVIRRGAFGELAAARLAQGLSGPAVQIGAGVAGFGVAGLLIGQAVSQGGGFLRLWKYFHNARKNLGPLPPTVDLLKRYQRFPKISLLPAFINALGLQLPILLVGHTHGVQAAGIIAVIFRILGGPVAILGAAASQVMVSEGAKLRREGQNTVPLMNSTIRRQLIVTSPALILTPLMPWLFPLVFGPKWAEAGIYSLALVPTLIIIAVFGPTIGILDIYERQDLQLFRESIRVVSMFVAVYAASLAGGSMWAIVLALSIALIGNCVFGYFLAVSAARRDSHTK